ncbi:MAG: CDP-alcohol phosphatidyltransferase family protein [Candidatus Kapabacteria bacterium]|nr:CDP-alcohol phosphatidyltransferase family protein [Candidatus Kapabacteria bacterium]
MKSIPNIISIIRGILAFPLAFAILYNYQITMIVLIFFFFLSDYLDGYLARLFDNTSEMGKILDPVADKICIALVAIVLLKQGKIPIYFLVIAVLRDLLIIIGGLYAKRKLNFVIPSNILGKITANVLALYFIGLIYNFQYFDLYGHFIVTLFLIISFIVYLKRFVKTLDKGVLN